MIHPHKFVALLVCLCCIVTSGQPLSNTSGTTETPSNVYTLDNFPARGGAVDLGVAISGGGIRSGSYAVGALKSLYDLGVFQKIDAISTVSGGGYAMYWVLGNEAARGEKRNFGDATFNDNYLGNVCRLWSESKMYPFTRMVWNSAFNKEDHFQIYSDAIHATFGQEKDVLSGKSLADFRASVYGDVPYLIVNTSQYTLPVGTPGAGDATRSVELTPFHLGNSELDLRPWSDVATPTDVRRAYVTSAAGDASLRRSYAYANKITGKQETVELYDGGCSENLAALPLIRRGMENVVIIDAEHDPNLEFESYWKLKAALKTLDIELAVTDVEKVSGKPASFKVPCPPPYFYKSKKRTKRPLAKGFMFGEARNSQTKAKTNIYYVKMSQSDDVFPQELRAKIEGKRLGRKARQSAIGEHFDKGRDASFKFRKDVKDYTSGTNFYADCAKTAGLRSDLKEMYSYQVNLYMFYADQLHRTKTLGWISDFLRYDYPHTTTATQSYKTDQMEAFIGLGYLQAQAMKDELIKKKLLPPE